VPTASHKPQIDGIYIQHKGTIQTVQYTFKQNTKIKPNKPTSSNTQLPLRRSISYGITFTKDEQLLKNNTQKQNKTEHRVLILLELAHLFGSKYKHEEI
jgi:hypothetical protein